MKRISQSKRRALKRNRNIVAKLSANDRAELQRFADYLKDPMPHGQEKYDKHYPEPKP